MRRSFHFRWVMALALFLGQYAAFAHEYGTDKHEFGAVCQICLHNDQAKEFLHSAPLGDVLSRMFVAPVARSFVEVDVPVIPVYRSRAPPLLA